MHRQTSVRSTCVPRHGASHANQMPHRSRGGHGRRLGAPGQLAGLAAVVMATAGCTGDNITYGPDGPAGESGPAGQAGAPGTAHDDLSTWDAVIAGIGGQAALDGLTGFTVQATGVRRMTGEGLTPGDPPLAVDRFQITTHVDLDGDAMRVDWNRTALFFGGAPLSYSEIINGNLGYVDGDDSALDPDASTTDMPSARWAAVRKQVRLTNPHVLLAAISANPGLISAGSPTMHHGAVHPVLEVADDVYPISLAVDPSTGHIAKLSTMENDHLHRDILIEVEFHDWTYDPDGGAAFPMTVLLSVNGHVWHEEYRTTVTQDPGFTNEFDFPDGANPTYDPDAADWGAKSHQFIQGFSSLGITHNAQQLAIVPTLLTDGVFFLGGSSHNSMAVEQENGVVIIEAPLYPERSEAILAWVAAEPSFDGKSVTHLVVTHHHHDHSAGFRPFVAAGARIVVSAASAGFLANLTSQPSTVVPDALAATPRAANLLPVTVNPGGFGTRVLPTSPPLANVIAIQFHSTHAKDMLIAFVDVPNTGADYLFESDLFSPDPSGTGSALSPVYAQELLDVINNFGLNQPGVTLVGGHGSHAPLTQLEAYLNP